MLVVDVQTIDKLLISPAINESTIDKAVAYWRSTGRGRRHLLRLSHGGAGFSIGKPTVAPDRELAFKPLADGLAPVGRGPSAKGWRHFLAAAAAIPGGGSEPQISQQYGPAGGGNVRQLDVCCRYGPQLL